MKRNAGVKFPYELSSDDVSDALAVGKLLREEIGPLTIGRIVEAFIEPKVAAERKAARTHLLRAGVAMSRRLLSKELVTRLTRLVQRVGRGAKENFQTGYTAGVAAATKPTAAAKRTSKRTTKRAPKTR